MAFAKKKGMGGVGIAMLETIIPIVQARLTRVPLRIILYAMNPRLISIPTLLATLLAITRANQGQTLPTAIFPATVAKRPTTRFARNGQ
jgi:hypothetical protein